MIDIKEHIQFLEDYIFQLSGERNQIEKEKNEYFQRCQELSLKCAELMAELSYERSRNQFKE